MAVLCKWTVFAAWPGTKRGTYDEVLIVIARNRAEARRRAEAQLANAEQWKPGGKVMRVDRIDVPPVQIFAIR